MVGMIVLAIVNVMALLMSTKGMTLVRYAQPLAGLGLTWTATRRRATYSAPYLVSKDKQLPQPLGLPIVAIVFSQETPLLVATGALAQTIALVIANVEMDPRES